MVKWGILGTGNIVKRFLRDFKFSEGGKVVAVASRSMMKAKEVASVFSIPAAYGSYEDLIADPEVDVVYVGTPHHLHLQNVRACMEGGKHVMCEKPLSINTAMVRDMFDAGKFNNKFLMEAMWTYFLPPIHQAKKWIDDGEIGEVQLVKADFGFKSEYDAGHRLFDLNMGGGALLDVGIYPIALSLFMVESPVKNIMASAQFAPSGADASTFINLEFENGVFADLSCSVLNEFNHTAYVYGSEGSIEIPMFWEAREVILKREGEEDVCIKDGREAEGFVYEINEVNRCIAGQWMESAIMSKEQSVEIMHVMDRVRAKIKLRYPME